MSTGAPPPPHPLDSPWPSPSPKPWPSPAAWAPVRKLRHSLGTVWLFTASDHLTFVAPETLFGVFGALSGPALGCGPPSSPAPPPWPVLSRLPLVLAWTWLNTLVFTLANQGSAAAAREDAANKAWRPLPSGRVTVPQTRAALLLAIPLLLAVSHLSLGSFEETAVLLALTWMYNGLGGGDDDWRVRNLLIATAYAFYGSGALRVAAGAPRDPLPPRAVVWLLITAAVVLTTIPVQDLKDAEGDAARGRATAVTVLGDALTRRVLAAAVVGWSVVCPVFWAPHPLVSAVVVAAGACVAARLLWLRDRASDRLSWKVWSAWLMGLYALPLFSRG